MSPDPEGGRHNYTLLSRSLYNSLYTGKPYNGYFNKQFSPRCNAALCGISSGSTLFVAVKDFQTKKYNIFFKLITWHPRYVQWTIPSLLFQTNRKNPLVYKGLTYLRSSIDLLHCFFNISSSYKCRRQRKARIQPIMS